jgi:hypothetical protein
MARAASGFAHSATARPRAVGAAASFGRAGELAEGREERDADGRRREARRAAGVLSSVCDIIVRFFRAVAEPRW